MALHRAIATVGAIAAALVGSGCSDEIAPPPPPPATADIAAGGQHTCRLTGAGTTAPAFCWGDNSFGQLGDGSTTSSATPVPVSGGLSFTQLTTGSGHTCGLTAVGAAYCWGRNAEGQLGIGSTANSSVPVSVAGGLTLTALAAGSLHTCGLTSTGTAYCWGNNVDGRLGDGSTTNSTTPVAVSGGTLRFTALAPGELHTCALTGTGAAYCWGDNIDGQLGTGSTTDSPVPVAVSGGLSLTTIAAGYGHSCGLTSARVAYCWGRNTESQLGNGAATGNSLVPGAVSGSLTFTALVTGSLHTCGLTSSGAAYCWGYNADGRGGDGTTMRRKGLHASRERLGARTSKPRRSMS